MISRIILGCHNLTGGSSYLRSKRLIDAAFDLGIRRFDVAPSYGLGTAEKTLASALGSRRRRPDVEITTKFGLLPPRFGGLASWVREPYRLARRLATPVRASAAATANSPASAVATSPAPEFPFRATEAALRSLRALDIDCLAGFLIHERLSDSRLASVSDEIEDLKRRGLIVRAGISGELRNVHAMSMAIGAVDIVQVAIADAGSAPIGKELRVFNLTRTLRVPAHQGGPDRELGPPPSETEVARTLSGTVHRFLVEHQQASVLFNSSSPHRLELFLKALDVDLAPTA